MVGEQNLSSKPGNHENDIAEVIRKWLPYFCACLGPVIPLLMLLDSRRFSQAVSDFQEYYTASWLLVNGKASQVYDAGVFAQQQLQLYPDSNSRVVGFYLTPLVVPFVFPIALLPNEVCSFLWQAILLLCVLASVVLLSRILKLDLRYSLMLWAFVSIAGPTYECLRLAQIGPLLLLSSLGAIFFLLRGKEYLAGVSLIPLLAKPHLILPLAFIYLGGRRVKAILVFAVCAALLFLISLLAIGVDGWQNYFGLLSSGIVAEKHYTPTFRDQVLLLMPFARNAINLASVVLFIVALIFSFYLGRRYLKSGDQFHFQAAMIAFPLALLFSPYVQLYDWILFIPSIAVFFAKGYSELVDRKLVILLFVMLSTFLLPFSAFIHYYYVLKGGLVNPSFWVGLLFFVPGGEKYYE